MTSPEAQDIKARVRLSDIVGETVALTDKGGAMWGSCPFHEERTASFKVDDDKGAWYCHGACKRGGDVYSFLMESRGIDFKEALEIVRAHAGGSPIASPARRNYSEKPKSSPPPAEPKRKLTERWGPKPTRAELAARYGLTVEDYYAADFTFGVPCFFPGAPEPREQESVLYPITMPGALVPSQKKFKSLARVEHVDAEGRVVTSKRACMVKKPHGAKGTGLIGASDLQHLTGLPLVLAGGEEKLLAARKAGFRSVCTQNGEGKLTPEIADWIAAAEPSEVILAHDADTAGREGVAHDAAMLRARGIFVRAVVWPEGDA